jgi:hypothetical protein
MNSRSIFENRRQRSASNTDTIVSTVSSVSSVPSIPSIQVSQSTATGTGTTGIIPSEVEIGIDNDSDDDDHEDEQEQTGHVSVDQERQVLLLVLLAQICALHDPTPRTFTVRKFNIIFYLFIYLQYQYKLLELHYALVSQQSIDCF